MSLIISIARKTIGGYLNASEHQSKENTQAIHNYRLEEALFDSQTHKMMVRAINKVKESGAEVCDLNILSFLERHGIPRNIEEENEISLILAEFAITPRSFQNYIQELRLHRASKVAI